MEVNYLLKDDLVHEVGVRGYQVRKKHTALSLAKDLSTLLRKEEQGEEFTDVLLPLDADDELLKIGVKLNEVSIMLSKLFKGEVGKSPVRVRALLSHLNRRVSRLWSNANPKYKDEIKTGLSALKGYVAEFRGLGEDDIFDATTVLSAHSSKSQSSQKYSGSCSHHGERKCPKPPPFVQ